MKKLTALLLALCLLLACTAVLAEDVDYTTYTFEDWSEISYEDWDAKPIKYQIYYDADRTAETGAITPGFTIEETYILINYYEDGTFLMLQAGLYDTEAPNAVWYDEENHVSWASFGFWKEGDNFFGHALTVYFFNYLSAAQDDTVTVQATDAWAEADGAEGRYRVEIMAGEDGKFVFSPDENHPLRLGGLNDNGEGGSVTVTIPVETENFKYPTIEEWEASFADYAFADL